ncbi:protein-S-isoprenylcysteine O-methyltransferase [Ochrobactrum sp. AN78]|uniref:protein-S-isoprenylcysteine O-methyltransferase n=1 Tax=Ochrobactrum sp. AN78 TaxID=3039853 RepID=UPI002989E874|nr:protein-S-isoprenylcysteine O-methyltransferase [Ochrobactrum sp. AN78]MDH7792430.1 protein-S-isoprenylcysteine O-methyltransferase Ste14 [Ochrobactrum sp. AN78]
MTPQLAMIIWATGLVAWVVIRLPHRRRARKTSVAEDQRTGLDRLALAAATFSLSLVPLVYVTTGFPSGADMPFQPWLAWTGLGIEIAFLALFYASHQQLGRNWSVSLQIRNEHALITEGLYHYVRHPMYLSFWLWALAQFCLLQNWIVGAAALIGVGFLYFYRVPREEAMMQARFGAEYDAYCRRTGSVIPKFWLFVP